MNPTPVTDTLEFGVPGVALEPGDHICALYVSQTERDQIMPPFLQAGLRVTAGETYLRTRPFSTEGILDFWRETVPVAAAEGSSAFSRLAGEMPWAILCLYGLGHFGGGILLDLSSTS
jgi:hypothetical protein